jgi:hypothetical protein
MLPARKQDICQEKAAPFISRHFPDKDVPKSLFDIFG